MNIEKFQKYKWKKWIDRPFYAFIIGLFKEGATKENFSKIGVKNVECEAWLFQYGSWYESDIVWDKMAILLEKWLKKNSIFDVSESLRKFHKDSLKKLDKINQEKSGDLLKQLDEIREILSIGTTYLWLAHGLEKVYKIKLDRAIKGHNIVNPEKFIGDISFPKKKNISTMMTEAILRGDKATDIHQEYSWIRVRDGFDEPYSLVEIKEQIKNTKQANVHDRPNIPKDMEELVLETQELVFYRTERSDIFGHLFFKARPLLERVAEHYNIKFEELRYYSIQSLIQEKPKRYKKLFSALGQNGYLDFYDEKIIADQVNEPGDKDNIRGNIAFRGIVKGIVRIVKTVADLPKVKQGDILVTQMTFPNFVPAMNKAAAFVTDEGGITCHAAIVAREMKRPCVIGTRIATQVFKDGDMVEVDAEKGIIRKIK